MNTPPPVPASETRKLSVLQYIWIGWPVLLIFAGGLIGGACGGAAIAINHSIFQKTSHTVLRYVWTGLISLGALLAYVMLVLVFRTAIGH